MSRAGSFVNRAAALPGQPALAICSAAAIILASVAGPFGTGEMPVGARIGLWASLIGLNALLWQIWFALTVRKPADWTRSALIGGLVLNLPLPLEIALLLRAFGLTTEIQVASGWAKAFGISLAIMLVVMAARWTRGTPATASIRPGGLLAKAGASSPAALVAIRSEDHYCRVTLADGRAPLIHYRFRDALNEVEGYDGLQVHRSHWVADQGVKRAERRGRAWSLVLTDGAVVPVSAGRVPQTRLRGWLARQ